MRIFIFLCSCWRHTNIFVVISGATLCLGRSGCGLRREPVKVTTRRLFFASLGAETRPVHICSRRVRGLARHGARGSFHRASTHAENIHSASVFVKKQRIVCANAARWAPHNILRPWWKHDWALISTGLCQRKMQELSPSTITSQSALESVHPCLLLLLELKLWGDVNF